MRITTNGRWLIVSLDCPAGTFDATFDALTPWAASLLREALQEKFSDRVKTARRDAYAQGWRDAKAKRKRETWFAGWLP